MSSRSERLMPDGVPRYVRCYDNGGGARWFCRPCLAFQDADGGCQTCSRKLIKAPRGSIDRYTVVFSGNFAGRNGRCHYLAMNGRPFHPQGFGQHGESGRVIDAVSGFPTRMGSAAPFGGRRIPFENLPDDCRAAVICDYKAIWNLT
jgi:hypothetical protein